MRTMNQFVLLPNVWATRCCDFLTRRLFPVGDYEVSIRFNDEHVPDSPFVVPVASPSDDARRLTVASLQVRL